MHKQHSQLRCIERILSRGSNNIITLQYRNSIDKYGKASNSLHHRKSFQKAFPSSRIVFFHIRSHLALRSTFFLEHVRNSIADKVTATGDICKRRFERTTRYPTSKLSGWFVTADSRPDLHNDVFGVKFLLLLFGLSFYLFVRTQRERLSKHAINHTHTVWKLLLFRRRLCLFSY